MTQDQKTTAEEMQSLLDSIGKYAFDCGDAICNAASCLEPKPDIVKCQEYLTTFPPEFATRFGIYQDEVEEHLGINKVRDYIRTLEKERQDNGKLVTIAMKHCNAALQGEQNKQNALFQIMEALSSLSLP